MNVFLSKEVDGKTAASLELMRGVDEAEILHIETQPAYRRQGLAQSLLQEACNWARQNQRQTIWLEVRPSNLGAIALYEKIGFARSHTRKQYYTDGEDATVMKYTV